MWVQTSGSAFVNDDMQILEVWSNKYSGFVWQLWYRGKWFFDSPTDEDVAMQRCEMIRDEQHSLGVTHA
jgi:hypothetical protein